MLFLKIHGKPLEKNHCLRLLYQNAGFLKFVL